MGQSGRGSRGSKGILIGIGNNTRSSSVGMSGNRDGWQYAYRRVGYTVDKCMICTLGNIHLLTHSHRSGCINS